MEEEEKKKIAESILIPFLFVALLWIVKLSELYLQTSFANIGILPRTYQGLLGIATGPLLHGDIYHLGSNTLPLLILGIIIMYFYRTAALQLFIWLYLATGILVWMIADGTGYHIGASGLIYGLVSFLFFSGVFRKDRRSLALALLVTFVYGGMVWGVFPLQKGISWESHLFGGITGLLCAWLYRNSDPFVEEYDWMQEVDAEPVFDNAEETFPVTNQEVQQIPYFRGNTFTSHIPEEEPAGDTLPGMPQIKQQLTFVYIYKEKKSEDSSEK